MSEFKFSLDAAGEVFTVKAPPGMTFDQAKAIFDKQASTGSLTGLKIGDALSSATQAALRSNITIGVTMPLSMALRTED